MNTSDAELIAIIDSQLMDIPDENLRESIAEMLSRFEYSSRMFSALENILKHAVEEAEAYV